jgi:hypothetical protein
MREFDISAHPLLDQGGKQSGCEAKHKAQCPHGVDTNDGVGGRTGRIVLRWDRCIIRETSKLLRDLPKIKRIPVAGIGGQFFIAFYEKDGHGCREQTSLDVIGTMVALDQSTRTYKK